FLQGQSGQAISCSIGEDITESRRAESALRESHELLRAIAEGTSDAIYVKDAEHRYLFVNSVAAKGLGYKKKKIIGRSDKELLPTELVQIIDENDNQVLEGGRLRVLEERVAGRIWSVKKWPLRDANRKTTGLIGISRDITEIKRSQELSNALNRINTSITSTLDFDEIIERAIKEASQAIDCESGALILREEGYWGIKYMYKMRKDKIGVRLNDEKAKHLVLVEETKKVLVVDDCQGDKRVDQELMKSLGIRSFLAVPLIKKDRLIGVLAFHNLSSPGSFGELEIDFAGKVASSVSLAIENAQLYFDQRNIANTLQETFLTAPKEIKGLDIGHIYKSASEIAKVGGDFFDLFELKNNEVCIL
ncbi:MAG: PAS domain S-box protein, partial [Actinomycetia bacterium]|nr:PAS domain S-box protein [Actinomycetes bacterium]